MQVFKRVLVLLILTVLEGCSSAPKVPPEAVVDPYEQQRQRAIDRAVKMIPVTGQLRFNGHTEYVIMSDFNFDPGVIRLPAGKITRVRLSNSAWVTHYFGGDKLFREGVEIVNLFDSQTPVHLRHIPVSPFSERDLYLFAKQPGEYELTCFVPNHVKEGMVATVLVEAPE